MRSQLLGQFSGSIDGGASLASGSPRIIAAAAQSSETADACSGQSRKKWGATASSKKMIASGSTQMQLHLLGAATARHHMPVGHMQGTTCQWVTCKAPRARHHMQGTTCKAPHASGSHPHSWHGILDSFLNGILDSFFNGILGRTPSTTDGLAAPLSQPAAFLDTFNRIQERA